jgi:hypothetical protein
MIVCAFPFTSRLIILNFDFKYFKELISSFQKIFTPEPFASVEGTNFINYVRGLNLKIPYFDEVTKFELAFHDLMNFGKIQNMSFDIDVFSILNSLTLLKKPENVSKYKIDIKIDHHIFEHWSNNLMNSNLKSISN